MELREQLCQQAETTETLERRIAALKEAQTPAGDPLAAETLRSLTSQLKEEQQALRQLRHRYDQQQLSQMVKEGPATPETMAWWMNRY
jgi:hypothetical protein